MTLRWMTALATLALSAMPFVAYAETDATSTPADATAVAGDATATTDTGTTGTPGVNTCAGVCGKFFGDKAKGKCNCDPLCKDAQYNDCCPDIDQVCAPAADGLCAPNQCTGSGKDKNGKDSMCVCEPGCDQAGSCCSNFDAAGCGGGGGGGGGTAPAGSCKGSDCAENSKGVGADGKPAACYCDEGCTQYGDCCADKDQYCKAGTGGGDTGAKADVSSCTAKCAGKKCGDDDGCGGKCSGTCDNGGVCSAAKTCTGGSTSDASGSKDSGALDATGGTGGTGTTGTTNGTQNSSNASSCNASGTSNGGLGLALVLLGLIGAVVLRRRAV